MRSKTGPPCTKFEVGHPAMQSHKGDTSGKLEETIYTKERHRPRSIPNREDLLYSRHYTGLPGQAFCAACWDYGTMLFEENGTQDSLRP
jgi:hypothetical protein